MVELNLNPRQPNIVVLKDRAYVEVGVVPARKVEQRYKVSLYDEGICAKCDNLPNRHNDLCEVCPSFGGIYKLHKRVRKADLDYWSLPIGDIQYIRDNLLNGIAGLDIRKSIPKFKFRNPIKFTGHLYDSNDRDDKGQPRPNQKKMVGDWLEFKNGMVNSKPRSGKTVMAVAISTEMGMKTLIVANRIELLRQFRATYVGDKKRGRVAVTNAGKLEKAGKGPGTVVKIIEKMSDFLMNPDVALVTYQTLMHNMDKIEKYVNARYSMLINDEVHGAAADKYAMVIAALNMPYRLGLTATTKRKDSREILTERLIGPVVAKSKSYNLVPKIGYHQVDAQPGTDYKSWHGCMNWIAYNPDRNIEILREVFKDLREGHNTIIVPVFWRKHQDALVKMINMQAKRNKKKRGEKWPRDLAVAFHGKADRQRVLDRVDDGRPCVLIAINNMIKEGVDMATPTKLHLVVPTSAKAEIGGPMFEQLSYRVCTPMEGKREPEVTLWVDHLSIFRSCLKGLFFNEIVPGLKKENFKYRLADGAYDFLSGLGRKTGLGGAGASRNSRGIRGPRRTGWV